MDSSKQAFAKRLLEAHIRGGRVASTYLFTGSSLEEKKELATAFASSLLCPEKSLFRECPCSVCARVRSGAHPDVYWVKEDPKTSAVKIGEVRELKAWTALKPYEGARKVAIFREADNLTDQAQNALLKTLEEPPAGTVFCLLVAHKAHLFETIRSRSFEVRLPPGQGSDEAGFEPSKFAPAARTWEDLLVEFQDLSRQDLGSVLEKMMAYFADLMRRDAGPASARRHLALLEAFERVYEAKESLEDNVNQKLILTRLAVRLRRTVPLTESIL